jgi:cephalosporin hydroxylase
MKDYSDYEALFQGSVTNFATIVTPYVSEFRWFVGRIYNTQFESIDAELYYSMIRHFKPNLVIEIGSGHSTHFAADAIKENGSGYIICIDPKPRRSLPQSAEYIRARVQDVNTNIFSKLCANDILFIDSSHTTEEAVYHCQHILPGLQQGVLIHHHDVVYPYAIYRNNDPVVFGEPDVVLQFYRTHRESYEIVTSSPYVVFQDPQLIARLIKSHRWVPVRRGGSLWTRKQASLSEIA